MIITKKEFETITDKAIEKTFKEAQEKQKQLNVDMTAETGKQLKKMYIRYYNYCTRAYL